MRKSSKAATTPHETALEFIERYLRAQTRFLQRYSDYYTVKQQKVLAVMGKHSKVTITTSGKGHSQRRRYLLRKLRGGWKLMGIKLDCSLCCGTGELVPGNSCNICEGAGW